MILNRRANICGAMLLFSALCVATQTARAAAPKPAPRKANRVVETANFRIYGIGALNDAARIADNLESLRSSLGGLWLDKQQLSTWSPKCELVAHATASSYLLAVGQDQFATVGSSRVDLAGRRILRRRIDVRADEAGWFAAAVPHELTHLILADEFLGCELPNWADEGMAVLADSSVKQSLHLRDFQAGQTGGTLFRLADFVGRSCYPTAARIPVFYGQSLSLVKYLVERKSPADFVRFLHLSEKIGYDAAVAEIYGFRGLAELERRWLEAANSSQPHDMLASANAAPAEPRPSL